MRILPKKARESLAASEKCWTRSLTGVAASDLTGSHALPKRES